MNTVDHLRLAHDVLVVAMLRDKNGNTFVCHATANATSD